MEVSDAEKLKALEEDSRKLKTLLAEIMLGVTVLSGLNSKNGDTRCEAADRGSSLCVACRTIEAADVDALSLHTP